MTRARSSTEPSPDSGGRQVPERHRRHLDLDVDPVQERPGDAGAVVLIWLGVQVQARLGSP